MGRPVVFEEASHAQEGIEGSALGVHRRHTLEEGIQLAVDRPGNEDLRGHLFLLLLGTTVTRNLPRISCEGVFTGADAPE